MKQKKVSTLFLKIVILIMAAITLAWLIWFPQLEGRNVNADFFTIYFKDPFLAYVYLASTPYFAALHQAFKLLTHIEQNKTFSQLSINTLRNIKRYSLAFAGFIVLVIPNILVFGEKDNAPGVVMLTLIIIIASTVIATSAGIFQRLLQNAVDIKSENDLTV